MRQLAARHPLRRLAALVTLSALALACSSDGDDGQPTGTVTWCEARQVLEAKCQRCHADEGMHGAPFALETYDDTQVDMGGTPRWHFMEAAVKGGSMPPPGVDLDPPAEKPTEAERDLLLTWFAEGAKPLGGVDCD